MSVDNQIDSPLSRKAAKKARRAAQSRKEKWTRRGFITAGVIGGGALLIGITIRPGDRRAQLAPLAVNGDEHLLTAWVKLSPDNRVTAIIPHGEMGQGVHTALAAMLAEEMEVDWDLIEVMEAPTMLAIIACFSSSSKNESSQLPSMSESESMCTMFLLLL